MWLCPTFFKCYDCQLQRLLLHLNSSGNNFCESSDSILRECTLYRRGSLQTYHDWCTCAPICHLMPQLLVVKQGHVYEGGNRSGRRWEENLKSLSLTLSLSFSSFVAPCTVNTNHTIRKHTCTERERERWTRAAEKAPAHTRAPPSLFHSQRHRFSCSRFARKFFRFPESPVYLSKKIINQKIPALSSVSVALKINGLKRETSPDENYILSDPFAPLKRTRPVRVYYTVMR